MIPLQGGNLSNASASMADSFGSMGVLLPLMLVVVGIVLAVVGSARAYRWMIEATGVFAASVEYALKGVITAIFIGVFAVPIYLLSQLDGQAKAMLGYAIALAVAAYIGFVGLGYIGDTIWQLIKRRHVEATGHEPFEHWGQDADE